MQEPKEEHMEVAHRVLRYLTGTPGCGILLQSDCDLPIRAYCDVNWDACLLTKWLITGYLVTLGGGFLEDKEADHSFSIIC